MILFFRRLFPALAGALLLLSSFVAEPAEARVEKPFRQSGIASWYGSWHHGKVTANGEAYDMFAMTAAHKTIPLGTLVKVTRKDIGRSLVVRINDRGPYKRRRIIDLSFAAADSLQMKRKGVTRVTIEVVGDKSGRLLSDRHEFFVRLKDEEPTGKAIQRQIARLTRLGMNDAASLLHVQDDVMALGPFRTFEDAQSALIRVATTHPGASIMLAEKGSMMPAVNAVASK